MRPSSADFATEPASFVEARTLIRRVERARQAFEIHRSAGPRDSTVDFARRLATLFQMDGRL